MSKFERLLILVLTVVGISVVSVIGAALLLGGDDESTPVDDQPAAVETEPLEEGYEADEPVEPEGPVAYFGDGTYEVGVDVRPGRYRNEGDTYDGQAPCVAYTSKKPNDIESFVKGSTTTGPGILDVGRGLFLTVQGCQEWRRE